jgi:hypothetical protein
LSPAQPFSCCSGDGGGKRTGRSLLNSKCWLYQRPENIGPVQIQAML